MAVLSCLRYKTIPNNCIEYVHPWTDSCRDATLGLLIHAFKHSLRTYTTLYLFTAIMRRKKPSRKMVEQTLTAILQSTVFLTTHSFGYAMCLCTLRRLTGSFSLLSASFIPAFISSVFAINLERPSRRPILCLYVTNVATETLFRMAVDRGWVKPIKYGEVAIFTISSACLLYRFRGQHSDDSIFSLIRYVIGSSEEQLSLSSEPGSPSPPPSSTSSSPADATATTSRRRSGRSLSLLAQALKVYDDLIKRLKSQPKAPCCPHPNSCIYYTLQGGAKMFAAGYGIQILLRTVLSIPKILKNPTMFFKFFVSNKVLNLGAFLGLFTATFRAVSCVLRWTRGKDSQIHALPAGVLAGIAFSFYPDNTAALYVMWKAVQMALNSWGVDIPGGTQVAYSTCVAFIFHCFMFAPHAVRPSYMRWMNMTSGGMDVLMSRKCLLPFNPRAVELLEQVIAKTKLQVKCRYNVEYFGKKLPIG